MSILNKIIYILVILSLTSCGKEFLDVKRESNQSIPKKIADYQAILDRQAIMNRASFELALIGADEYYVSNQTWNSLAGSSKYQKNAYIWADEIYEGVEVRDWNLAYQRILYANMALDVEKINPKKEEKILWNEVKGAAHFNRAWNYFQLAQLFCKAYDFGTAKVDMGLPLRLDYDVSTKVLRSNLEDTYQQIIVDLLEAVSLLPREVSSNHRPSQTAAYALLARVYLNMEDFENAGSYAELALNQNDYLIDFNTLEVNLNGPYSSPFLLNGVGNRAIIYNCLTGSQNINSPNNFNVDSTLFESYDKNDLRKRYFFYEEKDGRKLFVGSYRGNGHSQFFTGLSTDDLWLIKAECEARENNLNQAMNDLNHLRRHRFVSGQFVPLSAKNAEEALIHIYTERRKELVMRGMRWEDLRRLNKDPRFATVLFREINETLHMLAPKDSKWVWPIPDNEVDLNDIKQNIR